ncbi:MAG: ECF transporter S component [Promethearchaeia archaeon]
MESNEYAHASRTVYLAIMAILTALTTVATAVFIIPFPTSTGYLNFGDILVMISGILLGPVGAFFAGGVGSATADAVMGYIPFVPITLVVKGCEGMTVSLISRFRDGGSSLRILDVVALIAAASVMLTGYLLGEVFIIGLTWEAAFLELVFLNLLQVIVGAIAAAIIGPIIRSYLHQEIGKLEISW